MKIVYKEELIKNTPNDAQYVSQDYQIIYKIVTGIVYEMHCEDEQKWVPSLWIECEILELVKKEELFCIEQF